MQLHEEKFLMSRPEILAEQETQSGRLSFIFAILLAIVVLGSFGYSRADETVKDQVVESGHNVKRSTKKVAHRTEEALCAKGDAACLAEKAKHRVKEGTEYMGDKANEVENKTK